jgi:hypothetical protein
MKNRFIAICICVMISGYCLGQDGSFANLTVSNFTKDSGAASFSGWGLNSNPLIDVRPNSVNRQSFVFNHHDGLTFSAHSVYGGIRFYNQGYPIGPLELSTGAKMVMSINNNSVGIHNATPKAPLDINADILNGKLSAVLGRLPEGDNEGEGTFLGIRGFNTTNDYGRKSFALEHSFYGVVNSSVNFLRGGAKEGGLITFNTNMNLERMRIDADGNVGIGVIDPKGYRLAVAGSMIAESVKVKLQGAWPDYVFAKDYQLPSLNEIDKQIKKNGHLPGIPSATEVKTNGVDLGELNATLLKKIEELTLYILEQDKRLQKLESNQNADKK